MYTFPLLVCLCQCPFQTQPGSLRGQRKTFPSPTEASVPGPTAALRLTSHRLPWGRPHSSHTGCSGSRPEPSHPSAFAQDAPPTRNCSLALAVKATDPSGSGSHILSSRKFFLSSQQTSIPQTKCDFCPASTHHSFWFLRPQWCYVCPQFIIIVHSSLTSYTGVRLQSQRARTKNVTVQKISRNFLRRCQFREQLLLSLGQRHSPSALQSWSHPWLGEMSKLWKELSRTVLFFFGRATRLVGS